MGRLNEDTVEAIANDLKNESKASPNVANEDADISGMTTIKTSFVPNPLLYGHSFPVSDWDRYEFVKFIGEGGMGRVYLAKDPRLKRHVALKFLRGDSPELLQRFFHEAQAQARIEHRNICKVYEVGEVQGQPFIAMQYIDGQSLKDVRDELTLEQKVKIMQEVAEALHSAHRLGLIHRDIKPANIMVERNEEGGWWPYVMDFGLAREVESKGQTMTGAILGTPAYMSPEQANGEGHKLDRRTDVYSLGATLYDLLVGHAPFGGTSMMEIMLKVIEEEPASIRKLNNGIPVDLETVVMKCLEKEPSRRYDSAKALAEDLQCYLEGEPIKARRANWAYLAAKKAKKHKAAVAISAISLVVVMVLSGMWLHAWWTAAAQARLGQQFGQEVERMKGTMRIAYLLPLHDTRRDKVVVQKRMQDIEAQMKRIGRAGEGPGNYALGCGYLALHNYEKACENLEKAWNSGYKEAEVGYALGQVLGELYQKHLQEALRIGNNELREARIKEIENSYRQPALNYLKASGGVQVESPLYVEGLIAFYEKRYDEALQKTKRAFEQVPSLYEAKKLEGDLYIMFGNEKQEKGDYDGALGDYALAEDAYQIAMNMARSDAVLYIGECEKWIRVMEIERKRGNSVQQAFEQALSTNDKALQADPESAEAYIKKSVSYWYLGYYQVKHGDDPVEALKKAVEIAQHVSLLDPSNIFAYINMGRAYQTRADYEMEHGSDPRPSLDAAIQANQKAIQINPNSVDTYNNIGMAYETRGEYEMEQGLDPRTSIGLSVENFQKGAQVRPNFANTYNNMGIAYSIKADYEKGQGLDPRASLDHAIENYRKTVQINPNLASAYINMGINYTIKAEYELDQGLNLTGSLKEGRIAFQRSIQIKPDYYSNYHELGRLELLAARAAMHRGEPPQPFFAEALRLLERALQLNSKRATIYQTLAELHRSQSEWMVKENRSTEEIKEEIKQGLAIAEQGLAINPQMAPVIALRGGLYLMQARLEQQPAKQSAVARQAQSYLEEALQKNPLLHKEYDDLLNEAKQFSAKR